MGIFDTVEKRPPCIYTSDGGRIETFQNQKISQLSLVASFSFAVNDFVGCIRWCSDETRIDERYSP